MVDVVEKYLRDLNQIRSSGAAVVETSYYGALETLFNETGKTLKPKVRCIINIKNRGAGLPDGGLFTPDQFQKRSADNPIPGTLPSRGAIEVKGTRDEVSKIAKTKQVTGYLTKYRQVLLTNLRDFLLLSIGEDGKPTELERYTLAMDEREFWDAAAHARRTAETQGERFTEYLKRVMLHAAPLAAPEDVAWLLASYARDARARVEAADLPALAAVRTALEESLGLKFEGPKGEHFFRSSLVQTLFYGVFSAWVLWSKQNPPTKRSARFDWRLAGWSLRVPMIKALFDQVATPSQLGPLGLVEVLDWTATALNRVDRASFFQQFEEGHAVQYFYGPFLKAFDPELRKELGVWYTPSEIVRYMVARVDTVLREEMKLPDGLADPNVYVLDPCCGTGAYLVEVLKTIHATLRGKGEDALIGEDLKRIARERVFGFEILPAPFVIAHLQLGLLLQNLGAPLSDRYNERVGIYLTNALTGWQPGKGSPVSQAFPEFVAERDAAAKVKRDAPILVVLGNPPYNSFAGVSPVEEMGLVEPYKERLISKWGIKKFNLDDLYVRFFRLAERRIAEMTGRGVVSFISNYSWVSEPSFVVLRQHLLDSFDSFWIENMHGNRKLSEYAPDGRTSETVFAIPGFSPGIQQGVVISLWVKTGEKGRKTKVLYRDDINAARAVERRAQLIESLKSNNFNALYERAKPTETNRFSFRPEVVASHYLEWPSLVELCSVQPFAGIAEDRHKTLLGIDRHPIETRMRMYLNPGVDWEALRALGSGLTENVPRFDAKKARSILLSRENFDESRLLRYAMRPFDLWYCYYSPVRPLWREPRPEYWNAYQPGTPALVSRFKAAKSPEGPPIAFARQLCDYHMMPPNASIIPFRLMSNNEPGSDADQPELLPGGSKSALKVCDNLSPAAAKYLLGLGIVMPSRDVESSSTIWVHVLAIGYSPAYLSENADGIRQDWPRIPLPDSKKALLNSADLGRRVAALLDAENEAPGVTSGTLRPEMKVLGVITRSDGGKLDPNAGHLDLTAGWGHAGKGRVTMPGKGKAFERDYAPEELKAIHEGAKALGLAPELALKHLGENTRDIYLNADAYWKNVPARVWDYTIGGYQVIKKWLSYREKQLLGRALTIDEIREVTSMVRRIAAILLLEPQLDENYLQVKASTYAWPGSKTGG